MKLSSDILFPLLLVFVLLFAQQAGAAHAVRHTLEDLRYQQQDKKNAPHSDTCEQCANYAQLGSALNVGTLDFAPPIVSGETIQHRFVVFRSTHVLAAVARGPPFFLQSFA